MSRCSRAASGFLVCTAVAAGVWLWNAGERLSFNPEANSARTFNLSLKVTAQSPGGYGSASAEFSAILNAAVSAFENDQTRLHLTLPYSRIRENDQVRYDSESLEPYDERGILLQRLVTSGVTATLDHRGRPVSPVEFVDTEAFEQIAESISPELVRQLQNSLTTTTAYPSLPARGLKPGKSWIVEPFQAAGLTSTPLRYELVALDADRITITVAPTTQADSDAVEYRGFLEMERSTGWPVRGRFLIQQGPRVSGEALSIHLSLHQPGFEFKTQDENYLGWAYLSLNSATVNLDDADVQEYFPLLDQKGKTSREEQLAVLEDAMLWFPPLDGLEHHGLFTDREQLLQANLMPSKLWGIRLIDQDGNQFRSDVKPDPRFNLRALVIDDKADHLTRSPFDIKALNDDELAAVHSVDMDLDIYAARPPLEFRVDREGNVDGEGSDDYQLEIIDAGPQHATLRISRKDGGDIIGGTFVLVTPRSANETVIPQYEYRLSTSQVEAIRDAYVEADGDIESAQAFEKELKQALYTVPEDALNRDRIVEIRTRTPFDSLELSFAPGIKRRETLTVRNGAETLRGGPVVGSVTLPLYELPVLDFPDLELNDIVTNGVDNGQLIFSLPEHGRNRCKFGLLEAPEVHGSPLLIQTRHQGWTYNALEFQLVSENGLEFFYDVPVKVQTQCITRISTRTEQVDHSEHLQRIDPYTIELSDALFEDIAEVRRIQDDFFPSYPLVGRNLDGQALMILSHQEAYQGESAGMDSRRLRFWGEVFEVTYPLIETTESRQIEFHLPPLP